MMPLHELLCGTRTLTNDEIFLKHPSLMQTIDNFTCCILAC